MYVIASSSPSPSQDSMFNLDSMGVGLISCLTAIFFLCLIMFRMNRRLLEARIAIINLKSQLRELEDRVFAPPETIPLSKSPAPIIELSTSYPESKNSIIFFGDYDDSPDKGA